MNDNEIIKALECCNQAQDCVQCEYAPTKHRKGSVGCSNEILGKALDLINRQKAKIEALEMDNAQLQSDIVNANMNSDHVLAEIDELQMKNAQQGCYLSHMDMIYEEAQAKIKRLRSENRILSKNADNAFQEGLNEARELYSNEVKNEIKAETIKEFVERLKEKKMQSTMDRRICTCEMIDNLVAEMTEGKE